MTKIKAILFIAIIILSVKGNSQSEQDVLRYSFTNVLGTARSMGCGNAFGALGADYGSLAVNPAGLARYRNSELAITPDLFNTKANSFYIDNVKSDNKFNLNVNHIGLVFAIPNERNNGWKYVNLAFGMNRIADFNKSVFMEGVNSNSSIVQHFEQSANGTDVSNLNATSPAYLAYNAYLLDLQFGFRNQYVSDFTYDSAYVVRQRNTIDQNGGMNDINIALSGNYQDKIYLGGSIDFYKVKYGETNTFLEEVMANSVDNYKKLTYTTNLKTTGSGVGAKLGVIFLPVKSVRVGLAYHTPAKLDLTDSYNSSLSARTEFISRTVDTTVHSPDGTYKYFITTPGRIAVSAAYIFEKYGFISIDYERIDYRNGKLTPNTDQSSAQDTFALGVNSNVQSLYQASNNLRIGGEYILDNVYFIRAGVGFIGSPYNSTASGPSNFKTSTPYLSCGFGIRSGNYFLDMGLMRTYATNYYAPYTLNNGGKAKYYTSEIQSISTRFSISMGVKF